MPGRKSFQTWLVCILEKAIKPFVSNCYLSICQIYLEIPFPATDPLRKRMKIYVQGYSLNLELLKKKKKKEIVQSTLIGDEKTLWNVHVVKYYYGNF